MSDMMLIALVIGAVLLFNTGILGAAGDIVDSVGKGFDRVVDTGTSIVSAVGDAVSSTFEFGSDVVSGAGKGAKCVLSLGFAC